METRVLTPQMVFMQPQRLLVPLFQRAYVWNQERQWEPLWKDVTRVADRLLNDPFGRHQPHFLGAVVVQQLPAAVGALQHRIIIDGQQRLTTLQLMLDALHAQVHLAGAAQPAQRLEALITNAAAFCVNPEDRFKVWPTNQDRPAFNAVMGAEPPVDHAALSFPDSRMVEAHRFFSGQAHDWLHEGGPDDVMRRAETIERSVRELLQLVVIDLALDENAQEIFETLNARGAPLSAADLIKNFVFQRLSEAGADVEAVYEAHWRHFETAFWEAEILSGRLRSQRASVFFAHWLVSRLGHEVLASQVFAEFKHAATADGAPPIERFVEQIERSARVYRRITEAADPKSPIKDRFDLFTYRTGVLESDAMKPILLVLLDPDLPPVPPEQLDKALSSLESWLVRRMLLRLSTNSYSRFTAELVNMARKTDRAVIGDRIEEHLRSQQGTASYWPDDDEVEQQLQTLSIYRRLSRGRVRMVLEAIEDHRRGFRNGEQGLGGERVARGTLAIEHVMPQSWARHWPLPHNVAEADRARLVQNIGNLTLLTHKLNGKVSNSKWSGPQGKAKHLKAHDVLMLNRDLLEVAAGGWDEEGIRERSRSMAKAIVEIWPAPEGHRSAHGTTTVASGKRVEIADLLSAGLLEPGVALEAKPSAHRGRTAVVLADGRLEVDGVAYRSPTAAAGAIRGGPINGWSFFLVDRPTGKTLSDLWYAYVDQLAVDVDEADVPDDAGGADDDDTATLDPAQEQSQRSAE